MFRHIFAYYFRHLLKEKQGFFWTLVFPILLSTLFYMAFYNLNQSEVLKDIPVALVNSTNAPESFVKVMEETGLFSIQNTQEAEAKESLDRGEISGYILFNELPELFVKKSGMNQSVLKTFLDSYARSASTVTNIYTHSPQAITQSFLDILNGSEEYIAQKPISSSNNPYILYFYSLLAMSCMMASTYGCTAVSTIQANQSPIAARVNAAPVHKMKAFLATISAVLVFQYVVILIFLSYLHWVLGIHLGDSIGRVMLIALVSCIMSISMGTAISALIAKAENLKIAILVSFTMLCSFLAGLMSLEVKYIVQSRFPIMECINPAALVTNAFYCLYYYDTYEKFYLNVGILAGISVLFCAITYMILRRQKYASV